MHLNFADGASMVLKPKDYLLEQNSIVSFPVLYLLVQFSFLWKGRHGFSGIVLPPSSSISQLVSTEQVRCRTHISSMTFVSWSSLKVSDIDYAVGY